MRRFLTLSTLLLSLLLITSCESSTSSEKFSIVVSNSVNLGEKLEITVNSNDKLTDYEWDVVYELGNKATSCNAFNLPTISCTLEEGGKTTVTLKAKTRDGETVVIQKVFTVLDMDIPRNQAPVIMLGLSSPTVTDTVVSTKHTEQKGVANFIVGEEVTFDFSNTTDDTVDSSELIYEVALGKDKPFQKVEKVFKHTFDAVGYYEIRLKVSDGADDKANVARKTFVAYISCGENDYQLEIDPLKVSITADSINNFFNYSAQGAVTGGDSKNYKYKWDFNGDGIYDSDWLEEAEVREYTVYAGIRNAGLRVWDTHCNYVKEVHLTESDPSLYDFVIPQSDGVPKTLQGPQVPGYYFLQGYIEGKDEYKDSTVNVPYVTSKHFNASDEEQWRTLCDYRVNNGVATISIKGLNYYEREGEDGLQHGMLVTINDLDVSGFSNTSTNLLSNLDGNVEDCNYYTDEGYDSLTRVVYRKTDDAECSAVVTIEVTRAEGSCGNAPSFSDVIILDGTYSCNSLKGTNGKFVEVKKGAFYCEVGKADACYGGGGGGGGLPPEEF